MAEPLTEYELARQKKLEENARLLASLGLGGFGLGGGTPVSKRSTPKRPRDAETPARVRPVRSATIAKDSPADRERDDDGAYDDNESDGVSDEDELPKNTKRRRDKQIVFVRSGRVYDSINGSSCHQCRQKTLDAKIACTELGCSLMMCFRCLPNRYGQDVFKLLDAGGAWTCPKCAGTCNCSFCMKHRGARPTGILIHQAKSEGFASVHEMLTARGQVSRARANGSNLSTPATSQSRSSSPATTRSKEKGRTKRRHSRVSSADSPAPAPRERSKRRKTGPTRYTEVNTDDEDEDEDGEDDGEDGEDGDTRDGRDGKGDTREDRVRKSGARDGQDAIDGLSTEEYEVEGFVGAAIIRNSVQLRTRWRGYDSSDDTYQPLDTVADLAVYHDFLERFGHEIELEHRGRRVLLADAVLWQELGPAVLKRELAAAPKAKRAGSVDIGRIEEEHLRILEPFLTGGGGGGTKQSRKRRRSSRA